MMRIAHSLCDIREHEEIGPVSCYDFHFTGGTDVQPELTDFLTKLRDTAVGLEDLAQNPGGRRHLP